MLFQCPESHCYDRNYSRQVVWVKTMAKKQRPIKYSYQAQFGYPPYYQRRQLKNALGGNTSKQSEMHR